MNQPMTQARQQPFPAPGLLIRDEDAIDLMLADVLYAIDHGDAVHALEWVREAAHRFDRHLRAEEEVLFPTLATDPELAGPLRELLRQHQRLELMLEEIETDLLTEHSPPPRPRIFEVRECLALHAAEEAQLLAKHSDRLPQPWRDTIALLLNSPPRGGAARR